jgi:wyosine [tRNA(Phe)-imidazoG37] synthetase (radical SAM superfamily)
MNTAQQMLTVEDHNRGFVNLTYIYPVVSRRARGVSVGVNLNPNNACNWHCAYCQVPGLVRGAAPEIDLAQLRQELESFLHALVHGRFMEEHVPPEARVIRDIAFSGNGEPTSSKRFAEVMALVVELRNKAGLAHVPIRVISNGSLIDRPYVQAGLRTLAAAGGEVWFKLDGGRAEDIARINGVDIRPEAHVQRLVECASLCPTWVQTCMMRWDGELPSEAALEAYLKMLEAAGVARLQGVHLYGVVRPSYQEEAVHLKQMTADELEHIACRIRALGLTVTVSP